MRFIDAHLGDAELSPQAIAHAAGVSVRHLHRLFQETGLSVGEWILQRRLQRARCDLADERFRGNTVLDVASGWGFKDPAHFSRAFRAAFGLTARDFRRQVFRAS
jgi:AraC-like DNA-binding protein